MTTKKRMTPRQYEKLFAVRLAKGKPSLRTVLWADGKVLRRGVTWEPAYNEWSAGMLRLLPDTKVKGTLAYGHITQYGPTVTEVLGRAEAGNYYTVSWRRAL